MNKQELIERIDKLPYFEGPIADTVTVNREWILKSIEQLDEPKKVIVPQFIADWLTQAKEEGYNIAGAIHEAPKGEVDDWLELEKVDIFAEAWVNGYTVEKEKRYLVKVIGMSKFYECLNFDTTENRWKYFDCDNTKTYRTHHTRKELEDADFGWVFDCPGIDIEEVE